MTELQVDDLTFEVRRSARRRMLEITVERDGRLVLSSPVEADDTRIQAFIARKREWVYQQIARKALVASAAPPKAFVDGEGFAYLGRSHRLRLVDTSDAPVKLVQGRFVMPRSLADNGREHLVKWYCDRARPWLWSRAQQHADRMEVAPAGVRVQDLGFRWGSCGKGGWLYFHWKTIQLPPTIAEYILVHELAHLHEPHHTPAFWRRVERVLPDYELRKAKLLDLGADLNGL